MSLFENLKNVFHFDISKLESIKFSLLSGNKFNINVNKTENKILNLNSPEDKDKVKALIKQVFDEQGLLIEAKAEDVVEGIKESESNPSNKSLLEYFEDKISPYDLGILRAALYIKEQHEKGESVIDLIERLDASFGTRGRNISKLCSAGYFESVIKPLYEEMSKDENLDKQALSTTFLKRFDVLVNDSPFAIFVHGHMTVASLRDEMLRKIATNKAYGIHQMNIHGIGNANVRLIEAALEQNDIKAAIIEVPSIEKQRNVMSITLSF